MSAYFCYRWGWWSPALWVLVLTTHAHFIDFRACADRTFQIFLPRSINMTVWYKDHPFILFEMLEIRFIILSFHEEYRVILLNLLEEWKHDVRQAKEKYTHWISHVLLLELYSHQNIVRSELQNCLVYPGVKPMLVCPYLSQNRDNLTRLTVWSAYMAYVD